jgi:hypothetical protein
MKSEVIIRQNDDFIDQVEALMVEVNNPVYCELKHTFTKGLYTRKILMPAGTLLTSKIHNSEHQYAVLYGMIEVSVDKGEAQLLMAGHTGITKIGTRRLLYAITDCIWITMHPTDIIPKSDKEEDIIEAANQVEEIIILKRVNKLIHQQKELT